MTLIRYILFGVTAALVGHLVAKALLELFGPTITAVVWIGIIGGLVLYVTRPYASENEDNESETIHKESENERS